MADLLQPLLTALVANVGTLKSASPEIACAIGSLDTAVRSATRRATLQPSHAYGSLVARAARRGVGGPVGAVATELLKLQESLPWLYHYPSHGPDDGLSERIAFAELIGPDGPMNAPNTRVGFTVIDEQTLYPFHTHPAVELYLVISGVARWRTKALDRSAPPGALILHGSNEPHSMQTFEEPLLALWGWSGDIDSPAVYS